MIYLVILAFMLLWGGKKYYLDVIFIYLMLLPVIFLLDFIIKFIIRSLW